MITCKECKHWQRNDETPMGECLSDKFEYGGTSDIEKDGLIYWDYEGYHAGFHTGEDFGCIHGEAK